MRALVAGVEAVLPDGSIHDGLGALKKDNRGYSLDQSAGRVRRDARHHHCGELAAGAGDHRPGRWHGSGLRDPQSALDVLRMLRSANEGGRGVRDRPRRLARAGPGAYSWNALAAWRRASTGTLWSRRRLRATDDEPPADLLERLLAPALESGLVEDAVIGASEAQAEAFWRIRDSISEAERASGPATQHDISVPVADMPRFMVEAARAGRREIPGRAGLGVRPSRRRQRPFPRPRRKPRRGRLVRTRGAGRHPLRPRPRHRGGRLDLGRAWHRPDEEGRARAAVPAVAAVRAEGHQARARSAGPDEPRQTG